MGWVLQRVFFLWFSIKEELFHSTLVSLAPELIRRRKTVSFQSPPTCTAHRWQVAPGVWWQKRTKRENMGKLGFLKIDDLSVSSTQEQKQNRTVVRRKKKEKKKKRQNQWKSVLGGKRIQWRLRPAEVKKSGSYTGLKVGATKTCMLSRELLLELHNRGSKEKGRAEVHCAASSRALSWKEVSAYPMREGAAPTCKQMLLPLARSTKSTSTVVWGDFFLPLQPGNGNFNKAIWL